MRMGPSKLEETKEKISEHKEVGSTGLDLTGFNSDEHPDHSANLN